LFELCESALNAQGDSVRDIFGLLTSLGYRGIYENVTPIASAEEILRDVGTPAPSVTFRELLFR